MKTELTLKGTYSAASLTETQLTAHIHFEMNACLMELELIKLEECRSGV